MKSSCVKLGLISCALAALTVGSFAASLQRADLPAEPSWIVHLDCDALRATTIGQFVLTELDKPETQKQLASFQSVFHLDPRTQLHALTLYSLSGKPEDGVLLVYADIEAAHLTTLAENANDHQSTTHSQHVIHNWIGEQKPAKKAAPQRVYAAIQGQRVIFGQREASVAAALDVLDGTTPNLASTKNYRQLGTAKHSFLQAAAHKLDLEDSGPQTVISRLAKGLRLEMGEVAQQATATLTVDASSEEVAGQIAAIAQGLLALVKLQSEKPEAVKLAQAISMNQDGPSVVAKITMSATEAIDLYKADAARKAKKRAARRAHTEL